MRELLKSILVFPLCLAILIATSLSFQDLAVLCVRADGHIALERSDGGHRCEPAGHQDHNHRDEAPPCGKGGTCIDLASGLADCNRPSPPGFSVASPMDTIALDCVAGEPTLNTSFENTGSCGAGSAAPALPCGLGPLRFVILLI